MTTTINMTGPGTTTIVDDTSAAVNAMSLSLNGLVEKQTLVLTQLQGTLAALTDALGAVADNSKASSSAIRSVSRSIGSVSSVMSDAALTNQAVAASVIQKNNFDQEVVSQTLLQNGQELPKLSSFSEQLKTSVKNGTIFDLISSTEGLVNKKINSSIGDAKTWVIQSTGLGRLVDDIQSQSTAILTPMTAKSPETLARNAAAKLGTSTGA